MNKIIQFLANKYIFVINAYYFYKNSGYFKTHHFEITIKNKFNLSFEWKNHQQYIKSKQEILDKEKEQISPEEFIKFSLKQCRHCVFIVFDCGDSNRFVQFWLADGKIDLSWPVMKTNKLKKYTYPMLGVLNELDIHKLSFYPKKPKMLPYYEVDESEKFIDYKIYFKQNIDDASAFTILVFKEVFKQNLKDLRFEIA